MSNCKTHRFRQSSRVVRGSGSIEFSHCNDCLAAQVTMTVHVIDANDKSKWADVVKTTVIEQPKGGA